MFDRYTESARQVIFFARCEASILGSSLVEPEHLLLGLLREDELLLVLPGDAPGGHARAYRETLRAAAGDFEIRRLAAWLSREIHPGVRRRGS